MFFHIFRKYKNVVNVDEYENAYILSKESIHDSLKMARRIGQAEWYYPIFVEPDLCNKYCYLPRFLIHRYLMIPG